MKQSHGTSFLKSLVSTAVGFGISFAAQILILPMLGVPISLAQNTAFAIIMTALSIARGYLLERAFEAMGWRTRMSAFAIAVLAERQRQITQEGWSITHDDDHCPGDLACAGAAYAMGISMPEKQRLADERVWPWHEPRKPHGARRDLVRAGALIMAEGERLDRRRSRRSRGSASELEIEERRAHV